MDKVHILICGMSSIPGGVEKHIYTYFKYMDKKYIQYHFLAACEHLAFEDEIKKAGGIIHHVVKRTKNPLQHYLSVWKVFYNNPQINLLHCHMGSAQYIYPVILAKAFHYKHIIAHSHGSHYEGNLLIGILHLIGKPFLNLFVTEKWACSDLAASWLFYRNQAVKIIPNAIEMDKFLFDQKSRQKIRAELKLGNKIVLGHIGRFCGAKNHKFLIQIFNEYHKRQKNSILVLVGDGPLQFYCKKLVAQMSLQNAVIFLGFRDDIKDLLCAFDVFLLPSFYEGFPVSIVEAQCNGLPCIVSSKVTKTCKLTDCVTFLPIQIEPQIWADAIENNDCKTKRCINDNYCICDSDYRIQNAVIKLQRFYLCQEG